MNIYSYITHKKKLINSALDKYLPSSKTKPALIHKAMRYSVFSKAKRIRPILTLASFEACGGKGNAVMPIACAIELIHTYTLIHDDLPCIDNDDFRRGRISCHKKFGEDIALLAGDGLLTLGFGLLSKAGNVDVVREVSEAIGTTGTIGGQVVDIKNTHHASRITHHDLDYIAIHKTGKLFEVAVKSAGTYKGVSKRELNGLSSFGKSLGWTFQLIDDLIDKDGYAQLHDDSYIRKKAEFLTRKAKESLRIFGEKADRLLEIANVILNRSNIVIPAKAGI